MTPASTGARPGRIMWPGIPGPTLLSLPPALLAVALGAGWQGIGGTFALFWTAWALRLGYDAVAHQVVVVVTDAAGGQHLVDPALASVGAPR